jgi:hypothetical protein
MEFDRAEKALAFTPETEMKHVVARKTLIWATVIAVIFYLGIGCGCLLERSNWREEVVGRGYAHYDNDKMIWNSPQEVMDFFK